MTCLSNWGLLTPLLLQVLVFCFAAFLGSMSPSNLNVGYYTKTPAPRFVHGEPSALPQEVKVQSAVGQDDPYETPNCKSLLLYSLIKMWWLVSCSVLGTNTLISFCRLYKDFNTVHEHSTPARSQVSTYTNQTFYEYNKEASFLCQEVHLVHTTIRHSIGTIRKPLFHALKALGIWC